MRLLFLLASLLVAAIAVALAARTSAAEHRAVPVSEILSGGAP